MIKLAIDNNLLAVLAGINRKATAYIKYRDYTFEELSAYMFFQNRHNRSRKIFEATFDLYKEIVRGKIQLVLLPTVGKEAYDSPNYLDNISTNSSVGLFLHQFKVELKQFSPKEEKGIQALTSEFFNSDADVVFAPNRKLRNRENDARIMAESVFAGANLVTLDGHFDKVDLIKSIIYCFFEKKSINDGEKTPKNTYKIRPYTPIEYMEGYNNYHAKNTPVNLEQ